MYDLSFVTLWGSSIDSSSNSSANDKQQYSCFLSNKPVLYSHFESQTLSWVPFSAAPV